MNFRYYLQSLRLQSNDKTFDRLFYYICIFLLGGVMLRSFQLFGSIICMYAYIQTFRTLFEEKRKCPPYWGTLRILFLIFIFLDIACVILQSFFRGNYIWGNEWLSFMSYFFTQSTFYPAFFLPLLLFIPIKEYSLQMFLKLIPIISIISFIGMLTNFEDFLNASMTLNNQNSEVDYESFRLFPQVVFSLFLLPFIKEKKRYIVVWLLGGITLLVLILFARRGGSLYTAIYLVIAIGLYLYKNNNQIIRAMVFPAIVLFFVIGSNIYQTNKSIFFKNIIKKGMHDTRSEVNEYFEKDVFNSIDLWFGRGLNGMYYCPQKYISRKGKIEYVKYRWAIETGFYHLILKGGLFFTLLYVLILGTTAIKGLFFSRNTIVKIFAIWIILSLIELYPFGWPAFDFKYLLVWMGTVLCYHKQTRNMTNLQICNFLRIN